jgi:hypothetical protein
MPKVPKRLIPFIYFLLGQLVLAGRFDWSLPFAFRSFVVYSSFYWLVFPTLYLVFRRPILTASIALPYVLPVKLLGIDPLETIRTAELIWWNSLGISKQTSDWFPKAFTRLPAIPLEFFFFGGIFILGSLSLFYWCKKAKVSPRLPLLLFGLILAETILHLSLRSPYTYIPHYEQDQSIGYWYHYFLFPREKGAVNLDYHMFRPAELLFLGVPEETNVLSSRLFPTFLVSPFLVFFHPLYVWILFNLLSWMLGIASLFWIAQKFFGQKAAYWAAFLLATSQGMIVYVGQPKMYASAIGLTSFVVAVGIWASEKRERDLESLWIFATILAAWQLSYENYPFYIGLALLPWITGGEKRWYLGAIFCAFALQLGFLTLYKCLPGFLVVQALVPLGGHPIDNLKRTILNFEIFKLLKLSLWTLRGFGRVSLHAFNFTLLPIIAGIWALWKNKKTTELKLLGALLLPAFLTYALMEMGESFYILFPRIVYSAHPILFIVGGWALSRWGRWQALAFAGFYSLYVNMDVWGFPWIYYLWFYRNAGFSFQ